MYLKGVAIKKLIYGAEKPSDLEKAAEKLAELVKEEKVIVGTSLISCHATEKLQDLVDKETAQKSRIDGWPEHWEDAGAVDVWKCPDCQRLYLNVKGPAENIIIYKIEKIGFE